MKWHLNTCVNSCSLERQPIINSPTITGDCVSAQVMCRLRVWCCNPVPYVTDCWYLLEVRRLLKTCNPFWKFIFSMLLSLINNVYCSNLLLGLHRHIIWDFDVHYRWMAVVIKGCLLYIHLVRTWKDKKVCNCQWTFVFTATFVDDI